jgi:hypothetical protein
MKKNNNIEEHQIADENKNNDKDIVDLLLKRYIKELNTDVRNKVKEMLATQYTVYCFYDGCMRDRRDYLHMTMLLSATLRKILKNEDEYDENEINKFEKVRKVLNFVTSCCYFFSFPSYIEEFFLSQ